jgi:hypothetical protein
MESQKLFDDAFSVGSEVWHAQLTLIERVNRPGCRQESEAVMSEIRVELVPEFRGDTVVLLAMDRGGLDAFRAAVAETIQNKQVCLSKLMHANVTHIFAIEDDKASVESQKGFVTWRFSLSKMAEVLEKLDAIKVSPSPCHHYIDISSPAQTLVLSCDEYVQDLLS